MVSDLLRSRKNCYAQKRAVFSALPKNIQEVHDSLNIKIPVTKSSNEPFVLVNDEHANIIVFGTRKNLHYLASKKTILMDGTFTYCAKFFHQTFTIHTIENGIFIPLIFALLPNKETLTYQRLFQCLVNICRADNIVFAPENVVIDFDIGIRTAALQVGQIQP